MALTKIKTDALADNAVTLAKIADNAVDLAEMASGTDGELITYDASGNPAKVAVGTVDHVLTSGGAGVAPTFQAVPAGGISDLSPYFMAHSAGGQVPSAQTWTKLTLGEYQDSDAAFASNRFTVPSGEGGRYFLSLSCTMHTGSSYFIKSSTLRIYKNGSVVTGAESGGASQYMPGDGANNISISFQTILTLAAGDYIEAFGYVATSECTTCAVSFSTRTFSGFKIGA